MMESGCDECILSDYGFQRSAHGGESCQREQIGNATPFSGEKPDQLALLTLKQAIQAMSGLVGFQSAPFGRSRTASFYGEGLES